MLPLVCLVSCLTIISALRFQLRSIPVEAPALPEERATAELMDEARWIVRGMIEDGYMSNQVRIFKMLTISLSLATPGAGSSHSGILLIVEKFRSLLLLYRHYRRK